MNLGVITQGKTSLQVLQKIHSIESLLEFFCGGDGMSKWLHHVGGLCLIHSKYQNRRIYNIIRAVQLRITQNNLKVGSRICNLLIFSLQYVCYLLGGTRWPGESSCLEDSEYVRKSWVESLGGQVTADWSDPYFKVKGQRSSSESFSGLHSHTDHFNRLQSSLNCFEMIRRELKLRW